MGATPKYRLIEQHLREVLAQSQVGDLLPTTGELFALFDVGGVQTVRDAYQPLIDAGYVRVQQAPQRRWVVVAVPDRAVTSSVSTALAALDEVENDLHNALRKLATIRKSLTMTPYERGHAAGYAEAAEREHLHDADRTDDPTTWFTLPSGEPDDADYERGWTAGWNEYFTAR